MMDEPVIRRRHFLARAVGFLVGGAWLGGKIAGGDAEAATAQTDLPYLGEIRMFAGSFEPVGWKFCNGQLLAITSYDSFFNLIGTTYGGDGQVTFALPDLRGRAPVHVGTTTLLGQTGGQEAVTLVSTQIPSHSHALLGSSATAEINDPSGRVPARNPFGWPHYKSTIDTSLASDALSTSGSSAPHNNMMPSLCINFIICVEGGVYPTPF
jgi:microcystin-dependent protein